MIDVNSFNDFCSLLRERFEQNRDSLNELDRMVGDGDHGNTMERAFRQVELASRSDYQYLGEAFDAIAEAFSESAGGAIGPLLAGLFAEGGIVFRSKSRMEKEDLKSFFRGGLLGIQEIGGAKIGDKTLVDSLAPAVGVMESMNGASLEEMLSAAAGSARNGAESTKEMTAAQGRAKFVGERSLKHQDPGATSMALILEVFSDFFGGVRATTQQIQSEELFQPPPGKLINHPDNLIAEDIQGLALAYPKLVRLTRDGILVRSAMKSAGKVGLAIGHGGGHTPSMGGFVGHGLLDTDVYGPLFTCASGVRIAQAIQHADRGGGVVLLVSNHSGDVLNARLALRRAQNQGIRVEPVFLGDDIATAPRERISERRGLGGLLFALKIGGGAAEMGKKLDTVVRLMKKTNLRTASLSVAIRPPTHPETGKQLFELPLGQIEIGTGVHGEIGVYRGEHLPANQIVDMLVERLVRDLSEFQENKILVFLNGAGGTSRTELHIAYRRAHLQLEAMGHQIEGGVVDSLFTTQDMGGFSLSLCVLDDELADYWNLPASAPCFRWPYE